jgi:hypothetical protein
MLFVSILQSDMAGLDEDVKGYEDWRALCGGDGDGLSVINEVYHCITPTKSI